MKFRSTILLGTLLISAPLFAIFSAYERIIPSSEDQEYHPKVKFYQVKENQYILELSNVTKSAWLVVCSEEREEQKRELRPLIWKAPGFDSDDIELVSPLKIREDRSAQIHLSDDLASRSYVALDFPTPVMDGGYYYTIDIPEFYRHLKMGANKSGDDNSE